MGDFSHSIFRPPGHVRAPGNLIITQTPPICQEENAKKIKKIIFPKPLTNYPKCGILLVSRGEGSTKPSIHPSNSLVKRREKSWENPLTNSLKCDTIRIQKERATHHGAVAVARMNNGRWETHESYVRPSSITFPLREISPEPQVVS